MIDRIDVHNHTQYSNLRLLDCINKPEKLIDYAVSIGLKGIAITDHESLSAAIKVNKHQEKIQKDYPYFKVILGNEIYLCPNRDKKQKYYHFVLLAKNKDGFRALRELSTRAWLNSYYDRGMERVVTTYDDLREIVNKYPNTLVASSACLGSQIAKKILELTKEETPDTIDKDKINEIKLEIATFISFCKELFKDDFYLEVAPSQSKEQIIYNRRVKEIAKYFNLKIVIGSDSHMLRKEDRFVHEAYLNSIGKKRDIVEYYEYAFLHTEEECIEDLTPSELDYEELCKNSMEIYDKIENYSLKGTAVIPKVEVEDYPKLLDLNFLNYQKYPNVISLFKSDEIQERYWINYCYNSLLEKEQNKEIDVKEHELYLERLEKEAEVVIKVSEKLQDCMFKYFNTFQHYIDLIWECGSIVGPNRGSSACFLSNYLMGITQLDPIKNGFYYWRFMNEERADELPKQYWAVVKKEYELFTQKVSIILIG